VQTLLLLLLQSAAEVWVEVPPSTATGAAQAVSIIAFVTAPPSGSSYDAGVATVSAAVDAVYAEALADAFTASVEAWIAATVATAIAEAFGVSVRTTARPPLVSHLDTLHRRSHTTTRDLLDATLETLRLITRR
jgi:hypothetical protein